MPYVLTVKNRDHFYTDCGGDEIPDHVQVYQARNILNNLSVFEGGLRRMGIHSKVLVPDAYFGWIPLAIKMGKEIIEKEGIDLIYVSCPPHSSSLIAARLKKITGVPFVLDLRDAWTLNPYAGQYFLSLLNKRDEKLENNVFQSADSIIAATEGIKDDYSAKYPSAKIITLLNGFDQDDIPSSTLPFKKFTIAYTGFFYGARSPDLLFAALAKIIQRKLIPEHDIQFLWAGRDAPFVHNLADHYQIQNIVNYIGIVSKKEADALLYKSHLLFFVIGSTEEKSQNTTLTGKIFPYLASGTPILAVLPDGSAKKLLEKYSDSLYTITSGDIDEGVRIIMDSYIAWRSGINPKICTAKTEEFRKQYNYQALTKRLARIFEESCP
jgi:glycosyltransferase involved in cell wall biosynthesis